MTQAQNSSNDKAKSPIHRQEKEAGEQDHEKDERRRN